MRIRINFSAVSAFIIQYHGKMCNRHTGPLSPLHVLERQSMKQTCMQKLHYTAVSPILQYIANKGFKVFSEQKTYEVDFGVLNGQKRFNLLICI